ncbi:type I methionyl aminopeptidase [Candidatus Phytoplasma melaleucae]|uniref:Methionine aminopeptidase n=1 Tax=Candidatus Phytoplasma melaleucae TaxID=2982630 RepID=A0ABT9DDH3_9MOLU|nr:type I methionyl aminopeptidase ['Melaleuca sp.' phytoplasma]MDO8168106.1 type I methionyl aminopeptidase ['Melaleuca sp.' phytoplasma]MDV3205266.1 type I methionyl aminopeptidase [Weeping tea tree witches'-broom phytoplasma]
MLSIKSWDEIAVMKTAGQILSKIKKQLFVFLKEGVSTWQLDQIAGELMAKHGVISAFKGYKGYKGNVCISVNEAIVHGLPSRQKILKWGDIVTLDLGIRYKGYCVDTAWTYAIGQIPKKVENLLQHTQEALYAGISKVKPGNYISDITYAISAIGKKYNYGIVEVFSGHGIGLHLHEAPRIFNFDFVEQNYLLISGMTFCIEPMFTLGSKDVIIMADGWTAISRDNSLSAHFEHTILVTDHGYEILT